MRLLSCVICNNRFEAKRRDALYCSDTCKQKAYLIRKGVVPLTEREATAMVARHSQQKTCCYCGRQFWSFPKGRPPKFCSDSCREGFRKAQIRALTYWCAQHRDEFYKFPYAEIRKFLSQAKNRNAWNKVANDMGFFFIAALGGYTAAPDLWGKKR